METTELRNFLEFYFIATIDEDEEIEWINKDLEQAGVDAEASRRKALDLIAKAKIDLKIEKGKKFKADFYGLMEKIEPYASDIEKEEPELALAFRKLSEKENPDMDELLDDKEKMMVMEYLRKREEESA